MPKTLDLRRIEPSTGKNTELRTKQVRLQSARARYQTRAGSKGKQTVCTRCRRLHLDSVFRRQPLTAKGDVIHKLGYIEDWNIDSSCSLCDLIFKTFGETYRDLDWNQLRVLPSSRIPQRGWNTIDTVLLAVGPSPYSPLLVPQPPGIDTVRRLGPRIKFDVVKNWLKFCHDNHDKQCGSVGAASISSIKFFKLIDCETLRIVPVCDQPYTALSYVWGPGSRAPLFAEVLPDELPRVIRDAIITTRALGIRYLWVDKYCINQQCSEEKKEQIQRMDLIYNTAELTIVAANVDADDGLPGVTPRRVEQPYGHVGKHFLISAMSDPVQYAMGSTWNARGWTYQEGVLSRRRLVFVDQQVYFECRGMYCCEALNLSLPDLHTRDMQRFKTAYCVRNNLGLFPRQLGRSGWEVAERIMEYSARTLTKQEDILDAFLGVLRALEKGPRKLRHCFGVPVLPGPPKPRNLGWRNGDMAQEIFQSYEWSSTRGFCLGLCWDVEKPTERRKGFPSWSWTGWTGKITWAIKEHTWRLTQGDGDLKTRVQLQDSRIIDWTEFEDSYDDVSLQVSDTIHVTAWATSAQLSDTGHRTSIGSYETITAIVRSTCGQRLSWKFRCTTKHPPPVYTQCLAIHLGHKAGHSEGIWVMVVHEVNEGVFERVGLGKLDRDWPSWPDREDEPMDICRYDLEKTWRTFCIR